MLTPLHQPFALETIAALFSTNAGTPQVACFDAAFHHTLPKVETMLPLLYATRESSASESAPNCLSWEFRSTRWRMIAMRRWFHRQAAVLAWPLSRPTRSGLPQGNAHRFFTEPVEASVRANVECRVVRDRGRRERGGAGRAELAGRRLPLMCAWRLRSGAGGETAIPAARRRPLSSGVWIDSCLGQQLSTADLGCPLVESPQRLFAGLSG